MTSTEIPRVTPLGALLLHLPDYSLVVCKSCKFAIQPKAISSHLLRHHIYRHKRQSLLDRVTELTLLEPDQVPLPTGRISAFPYLQVALGYRCKLPSCDHLCISHKRMKQHLREYHDCVNVTDLEDISRRAYLQTFFKGNKVRYFEVRPRIEKVSQEPSQIPSQSRLIAVPQDQEDEASTPKSCANHEPQTVEVAPATTLAMEDLLYLHHYITVTGPSFTRGAEPPTVWTHDLPLQGSAQPFLMHGILGAAAFHRALLASDPSERRRHQSAGLLHQSAGLATFRSLIDHATRETSTAFTAFARLLGVQNCVQYLLEAENSVLQVNDSRISRISDIVDFLLLLRGGLEILLSMQRLLPKGSGLILSAEILQGLDDLEFEPETLSGSATCLANELCARLVSSEGFSLPDGEPFRLESLTEVRQLMKLCAAVSNPLDAQSNLDSWIAGAIPTSLTHMVNGLEGFTRNLTDARRSAELWYRQTRLVDQTVFCPPLLCYPHIPALIYAKLISLPSRLMARVARADRAEIRAFDQAMAALISSFSRSHASDAVWARWNGIESWPRMISDYFITMVKATNPLALVLVAHWCVLLSMQEEHYWFLRGQSQRMLNIILENLDIPLQGFVKDSISALS